MDGQRWDGSPADTQIFEDVLDEGCGFPDEEDASFPLDDLSEWDDDLPEHAYPDRRPR